MFNAIQLAMELDIPPMEKLVFAALASYANRDGTQAQPGILTLAHAVGLGTTQTRVHLRRLEERGHIAATSTAGGRGRFTVYTILSIPDTQRPTVAFTETPREPVAFSDTQRPTVAFNGINPTESDTKRQRNRTIKATESDTFSPPVPLVTRIDQDIDQDAHAGTRVREGAESIQASVDYPFLQNKTYYADFDPDQMRRAVDTHSEWGYAEFLKACGQSIWTAKEPDWKPRYRQFCHAMVVARQKQAQETRGVVTA